MRVEYFEDGDLAMFNGRKYRRDKKTGYYLNSATHKRLHRAVWEYYNGEIPNGFHVHHIDKDKSNNEIENLAILPGNAHSRLHGEERDKYHHDEMIENLKNNALPKAAEWHRSEAGRKWHSMHAKETGANIAKREFVCKNCGKHFFKKPLGQNKFCSNACKAAYRRKLGVDNTVRRCVVCGKEFTTNKYSKAVTCSTKCRSIYRWRRIYQANRKGQRLQYGS